MQAKQKKSAATSNSKICCYYTTGIHRPTIKCQPITRAEFNALSYEEKTKGKHTIGETSGEDAPKSHRSSLGKLKMEDRRRAPSLSPAVITSISRAIVMANSDTDTRPLVNNFSTRGYKISSPVRYRAAVTVISENAFLNIPRKDQLLRLKGEPTRIPGVDKKPLCI